MGKTQFSGATLSPVKFSPSGHDKKNGQSLAYLQLRDVLLLGLEALQSTKGQSSLLEGRSGGDRRREFLRSLDDGQEERQDQAQVEQDNVQGVEGAHDV